MTWLRIRIRPLTAFGSPIRGDTLFGQLCWAVRERFGEERLSALLDGYTQGRPFLVVSDGLPAGHLPRPQLPIGRLGLGDEVKADQRKTFKKRAWMPEAAIGGQPDLRASIRALCAELAKEANEKKQKCKESKKQKNEKGPRWKAVVHLHNSISRTTGTTGDGAFAPYGQDEHVWEGGGQSDGGLDLHCVLDEARLSRDELAGLLGDVGRIGYGRDASIGLGKFAIEEVCADRPAGHPQANAWLTLAPAAPQDGPPVGEWRSADCFYQPFTRFGRHGSIAAVGPNPFKKPILLADTGAVLTPVSFDPQTLFIGHGLGGERAQISNDLAFAGTVHQGYAPVVPVHLPPAPVTNDDTCQSAARPQEEAVP